MTKIFNDGVLEAIRYENDWVFVHWLQNEHGKLQKQLIKDLFHVERMILKSKLMGWFTDSELGHKDFHKLLVKFGALPKDMVAGYIRFMKPIQQEGDLHVRSQAT